MKMVAREILRLFFALCCALAGAQIVYAAHPLISDDAGTLGQGVKQIELNGQWSYKRETGAGSGGETTSPQIATTVSYGVSDNLDFVVGFLLQRTSFSANGSPGSTTDSSAVSISPKLKIGEAEGFSIAIKPLVGYSYVFAAPRDDYAVSFGATGVFSKEFAPFALHLNTGYTYTDYHLKKSDDAQRSSIVNLSLAGTWEARKGLRLVLDSGVATNSDKTRSEMPVFALAGVICSLNDNIDIDFGVKFGVTAPEPDVAALGGLTLKF